MRSISTTSITALVCFLLAGCDSDSLDDFLSEERTLSIQTELHPVDSCRTIVSELSLYSDGVLVGSAPIDVGGRARFESVRIPPGRFAVDLRAVVLSTNGSELFEAVVRESIADDRFELELTPEALSPVMQICLPDGDQSFIIHNHGSGELIWDATASGPDCLSNEPSCLALSSWRGSTRQGSPSHVSYAVNSVEAERIELQIASEQGGIDLVLLPVAPAHSIDILFRDHR